MTNRYDAVVIGTGNAGMGAAGAPREAGSGGILGAHLLGHGGDETIPLFAFAMKHGLTEDDLVDTVYGCPTLLLRSEEHALGVMPSE